MRNKTTLIVGARETGKSNLVDKLTKNCKIYRVPEHQINSTFPFQGVDEDTEFIIVEDLKIKNVDRIKELISSEIFRIDRQGKNTIIIKRPQIIITSREVTENELQAPNRYQLEYIYMVTANETKYRESVKTSISVLQDLADDKFSFSDKEIEESVFLKLALWYLNKTIRL